MPQYVLIRELLIMRGEMTSSEIASVFGWTQKQASGRITHASAHGYIERVQSIVREYRWRASAAIIRRPGVGKRFPPPRRVPGRRKRVSVDSSSA